MTEQLLSQQLESPSGTGRVEPRVRSAWQPPPSTNGIPTHRQTILTGKSEALPVSLTFEVAQAHISMPMSISRSRARAGASSLTS